jgi:hypothetical protein
VALRNAFDSGWGGYNGMDPWLVLASIDLAGAAGGIVNAYFESEGLTLWRMETLPNGGRIFRPGFLGNVVIGAVVAVVLAARAEWDERGRGRVPCQPSAGARRDGLRASGLSLRTLSQRGSAGRALRGRRVSCSACDRWMPVSMAARHRLNTARRGSAGASIARSVST